MPELPRDPELARLLDAVIGAGGSYFWVGSTFVVQVPEDARELAAAISERLSRLGVAHKIEIIRPFRLLGP